MSVPVPEGMEPDGSLMELADVISFAHQAVKSDAAWEAICAETGMTAEKIGMPVEAYRAIIHARTSVLFSKITQLISRMS